MASPSGSESKSSSFGEEHSPSVSREGDTVTQSSGGVATLQIPSLVGLVGASISGDGHHTVPIGGELSRAVETETRTIESSGGEPRVMALSGDVVAVGGTCGPAGGSSDTMVANVLPASDIADDRPTRGDNVAMQGGESGSVPMEVDVPGMGAQVWEVEMDIGGVHVMVE